MSGPVTRLQILQATTAERISFVPLQGELIKDIDLNRVFHGDGVTYGGNPFEGEGPVLVVEIYDADTVLTVEDFAIYDSPDPGTFTLPDANGTSKAKRIIKGGAGELTVVGMLGQLINGNVNYILRNKNAISVINKDGAWYIY